MGRRYRIDEPNMSERTIIASVEDLICTAFGPRSKNTVNFKLIQTILHILARQLRLLEQDVEIKFDEIGIDIREHPDDSRPAHSSSSEDDEVVRGAVGERHKGGAKKERAEKGGKGEKKEQGEKVGQEGKGERGAKGEKKKDKEGKKKRERGSPGKSPRGRKGDDDGEEGGRQDDRKDSLDSIPARQESGTGITVTAERTPGSHGRPARVGSIEVVTASQFALLERAVKQLEQFTGPPPVPSLPDNEQLRKDLAEGRASLSETMEAVQLNARVQAAEQGLTRMAELLTQLAKAGALPLDLAFRIGQMQAELAAGPTDGADKKHGGAKGGKGHGTTFTDQEGHTVKSLADPSTTSRMITTKQSTVAPVVAEPSYVPQGVTQQELNDVVEYTKETIIKEIQNLTARANHSADVASSSSRSVAQKLATALQIDERITNLFTQTADYANQLSGFDTGLTTQMTSFQEQMMLMKTDLTAGLALLAAANNNAETAAVLDLSERYESLVIELDNTLHLHQQLSNMQQQLSDELRSLVECVEMLREQKADRDEVLDGLRDKADISRLAGLLYEKDFAQARNEIENRLAKCYDKFHKQDQVWQTALSDLTIASEKKAEIITLMALKESATQLLNEIQEKLHKLEIMLGEPKAALLMRQLARDAACGACLTRAMMPPADATYGKPCALPALRPAPLGAEDVCLREVKLSPPDTRDHTCHRWVGGSHTLVGNNVTREKAAELNLQAMPTKKFEGYGIDGRLYMMEDDMQPCAECNKLNTDDPGHQPHDLTPASGGGDQARG